MDIIYPIDIYTLEHGFDMISVSDIRIVLIFDADQSSSCSLVKKLTVITFIDSLLSFSILH